MFKVTRWEVQLGQAQAVLFSQPRAHLQFSPFLLSYGQCTQREGQRPKGITALPLQQSRTWNAGQNGPAMQEGEEERAPLAHQKYQV